MHEVMKYGTPPSMDYFSIYQAGCSSRIAGSKCWDYDVHACNYIYDNVRSIINEHLIFLMIL